MIDKLKLVIAALILVAGVVAYYQLPSWTGTEVSILVRVGVAIAAIIVALIVAATSQYGKDLIEFAKGSRTELRKMVWPTRAETIQTTGFVLLGVVFVALFLGLVDFGVFEVIYNFFLGVEG